MMILKLILTVGQLILMKMKKFTILRQKWEVSSHQIQTPKKKKNIIQETFLNESQVHNWIIGSDPINEFDVQYLASMAFPTLFPDGKGDPTNKAVHSEISDSATQSFADKLKHLIKFAEKRDEKWIYRFASHPRFAYWAYIYSIFSYFARMKAEVN